MLYFCGVIQSSTFKQLEIVNTENKTPKTVVTFTFHDNENLGKTFVAKLEETYGKNNVYNIDRSTYGINNQTLTIDELYAVLMKAEEKSDKHNEQDELHILHVIDEESIVLNSSLDFHQRLEKV